MTLADWQIVGACKMGDLVIDPFDVAMVQPASIDVCLSDHFMVFNNHKGQVIDVKKDVRDLMQDVYAKDSFVLHPNEFALGSTVEYFELPTNLIGRVEGKSSLGRLGLAIHVTAGFIDPGFKGTITLELFNIANMPIVLYPGMKIGQVSFTDMGTHANKAYGARNNKYQQQRTTTPSKYFENFSQ